MSKLRKKRISKNVIQLNEKEIIRLYCDEFKSVSTIANMLNVNHGTITLRLKKANIKFRTHSENQKIAMNKEETKQLISKKSIASNKQRIKTNMKKYGTIVPSNNKDVREKWIDNHIEKYGVDHPNKRKEIVYKTKETNLERYGVDNVSKTKEVRNKISQKRWKEKSEKELIEIKEKSINTTKERFGCKNALQNKEIKDKVKKSRWYDKSKEDLDLIKKKSKETRIKNQKPKILKKLDQLNIQLLTKFTNIISRVEVKCLKCKEEFSSVIDYLCNGYGLCPVCFPPNTSIFFEGEIIKFIREITDKRIETNNRIFLENKKEIDILIPSINLAIECDGIFYHSDKFIIDKNYHLKKTNLCEEKGYQLIHIFEDEWIYKKDIVKSRISNLLGIYKERVYARNCIIKEIKPNIKNDFLEENHIQGKDSSTIKLGAFYNNNLISVMTFSKGNISKGSKSKEGVWELNRFCSKLDYQVVGIAGKLLNHFKKNYEWIEIFSYADRRWSKGNVYYKLGFELSHITNPNYWYIKGMGRIHRFNLRKRNDEPKDIPEWILRLQEGYSRIWDCGNYKFNLLKSFV